LQNRKGLFLAVFWGFGRERKTNGTFLDGIFRSKSWMCTTAWKVLAPPILFGLARHRWRVRVLDLHPSGATRAPLTTLKLAEQRLRFFAQALGRCSGSDLMRAWRPTSQDVQRCAAD
jgi:hypothetical protein